MDYLHTIPSKSKRGVRRTPGESFIPQCVRVEALEQYTETLSVIEGYIVMIDNVQ